MGRNSLYKLVIITGVLLGGVPGTSAWAAKPSSPLTVKVSATGKAAPGASATFDVTVTSQMDGTLIVNLFPPNGATVSSGDAQWRGDIAAHGKKKLSMTLVLPANAGQEFRATAYIVGPNGARYGAGDRYVISPSAAQAPKQKRAIRKGEEVIEVPVPAK